MNNENNGDTRAGPARIVLVEDHEVLREGLGLLLRRRGFDVVAEVGTADEGAETISREKPEVSVIDVALPGESGIELARRLLRADGSLGILMYTGTADRVLLRDALDCGARGFVVKGSPPATFMSAVHAVAAGGSYFDPVVHSMLLSREVTDDLSSLSVREREILDLLARGLTGERPPPGCISRPRRSARTCATRCASFRPRLALTRSSWHSSRSRSGWENPPGADPRAHTSVRG